MKRFLLLFFVICMISLCGCTDNKNEIQGFSMDAPYRIHAVGITEEQKTDIKKMINRIDNVLDAYDNSSVLSELNHYKKLTVSKSDADAKLLYDVINGTLPYCNEYFDISIRPVSKLWDFNSETPSLPQASLLQENLKAVDYKNIVIEDDFIYLENNAEIELGAVAKGYACDELAGYLKDEVAVIDIGGTLKTVGNEITAGVKSPDGNGLLCSFTLPQGYAVATSGSYERMFTLDDKHYHHILNPKTGYPFDSEIVSVSVISPSAMEADIMATTLFAKGDLSFKKKNLEAIFVTKDREIFYTSGVKNFKLLHDEFVLQNKKVG